MATAATEERDPRIPATAHGLASMDVASAIYGSMLVTVLIAAQDRAEITAARVGLYVGLGVLAFYLTHIWAEIVGLRVRRIVDRAIVLEVAREETPMLAAAVTPLVVLAAGALGFIDRLAALDLALAVAIIQLFLWGVAVGRAIGRPWGMALIVGLVDLLLGLAIVALKVFVLH